MSIAGVSGNVESCKIATQDDQIRVLKALSGIKNKKKAKVESDEDLKAERPIDFDDCFGDSKQARSFGPMDKYVTCKRVKENTSKQSDFNNVVRNEQIICLKEYICKWAYESDIPFHAFEKDSFKTLLDVVGEFGSDAIPPTKYEMENVFLKKEAEKIKTSMKRYEEEWKYIGCSIMIDAWCDRTRNIMNLCVNSKSGTIFLSSKECSDEAHTSENIFEYVDKCIEEVGPENVVQVVTGEASNNIGASNLLKEKRPTIFWTPCATDTINLMLADIGGLPRYKKTLDQAKKLTVFIYGHRKTLAMMRKYTKKRNIVRSGVTRSASAFLTLQSLLGKKTQLRSMFTSEEWKKCKFSRTDKGKFANGTVISPSFWSGVTTCLKIFAPLVKVLRMIVADWKPSIGFIYGELQEAKKEIIKALNDNKSAYEPIMDIISKKSSKRLDTCVHLSAYILNPYYFYNNPEVRNDLDANDAVLDLVGVLFPEDFDKQTKILSVELPIYKYKQGNFSRPTALMGCEVNDDKFYPVYWWETYGNSTPNLKKIAMRILSLTTSLSGCERNWSIFEGVHTKKREILEASKMNDLIFVQFNANLMEKNTKRKLKNHEVLVAEDCNLVKEWIVDDDEDEEFESEDEKEVDEEVEYESDGFQIIEQYGQDDDE